MNHLFSSSAFFGIALSLAAYFGAEQLKKKFNKAFLNPLLISIAVIITVLAFTHISYKTYYSSAKFLGYLLTPATVCLAIPLYEQITLLKKNWKAVFIGIVAGTLTSMISIFVMAKLFHFTHDQYVTFLPKSITTAIGMGVSQELGGYVQITVAAIIITGILGNVIADFACRIFRITNPVAKGLAIGTASHAIGTSRAVEMGEVEGAMSGLSIAVSGLLTVIFASTFANFM